jgi:MraZ protein
MDVSRRTQVGVATLIWIVTLLGVAFAVKVKAGLPLLAIPELAKAAAPETIAESVRKEAPTVTAVAAANNPDEPSTEVREVIPAPRAEDADAAPDPRANLLPPVTACPPANAPKPGWAPGAKQPAVAGMNAVRPSVTESDKPGEQCGAWTAPKSLTDYQVRAQGETMREIARATLGSAERWPDVFQLNPQYQPDCRIPGGITLRLPREARVAEEATAHAAPARAPTPLPWGESLGGLAQPPVVLALWSTVKGKQQITEPGRKAQNRRPFIGTHLCTLDEGQALVLPQSVSEQMGQPRRLYLTPGQEECLWVCDAAALERLTARLAPAARRLYFAQTAQVTVDCSGRIVLPEWLTPAACLHQDVILLGVGDHFELWDTQRLQRYLDHKD